MADFNLPPPLFIKEETLDLNVYPTNGHQNNVEQNVKNEPVDQSESYEYLSTNPLNGGYSNSSGLNECNVNAETVKVEGTPFVGIAVNAPSNKHFLDVNHESSEESKCYICGKSMSDGTDVYEGVDTFTCNICIIDFSEKEQLKNHIGSDHIGSNEPICDSCCKAFGLPEEFDKDIPLPLPVFVQEEKYKCDTCGKCFCAPQKLRLHIKAIHLGIKDFKCETCGKTFAQAGNLRRHVSLVHEGVKAHKCEICSKHFSNKQHLEQHIICVHEKLKPYKCETCGKSFSKTEELRKHVLSVHEGVKDHMCGTCGKEFFYATKLKMHIKTVHDKVKDFVCVTCGSSFTTAGNLRSHISIVHEGLKPYKCDFCGKDFSKSNHLKKHIASVHGDIPMYINNVHSTGPGDTQMNIKNAPSTNAVEPAEHNVKNEPVQQEYQDSYIHGALPLLEHLIPQVEYLPSPPGDELPQF